MILVCKTVALYSVWILDSFLTLLEMISLALFYVAIPWDMY